MITDTGKNIIGKYLLGQAPAYASYIAIGCGPQPLSTADPYGNYSEKTNLDFEMFRVPISSRGFVTENNITKLVLTAELPTEERYEITEIGLYSAGSNPSAGAYDSKTLFAFTTGEGWQYHSATSTVGLIAYPDPLDESDDNIITTTDMAFTTNADNTIFYKTGRAEKYERCRFFNNIVMVRGDLSELTSTSSGFTIESGSDHIHLTGVNVDLTRNAPTDEIKLAFSVINVDGDSGSSPDSVNILIEFASNDSGTGEYARFETEITNGTGIGEYDLDTNRYCVITKQLQDLIFTSGFTWNDVTVIKIYATAFVSGSPSNDYYIALDAIRLENTTTTNPLYGMTGYTVVKNTNAETIVKSPNTSNYVEFRFSVGVS